MTRKVKFFFINSINLNLIFENRITDHRNGKKTMHLQNPNFSCLMLLKSSSYWLIQKHTHITPKEKSVVKISTSRLEAPPMRRWNANLIYLILYSIYLNGWVKVASFAEINQSRILAFCKQDEHSDQLKGSVSW